MSYTVWMNGRMIGEAMLEIGSNPVRRAGSFHPTTFGRSVLPGVTDMFPALVAFGEFCRRRKMEVNQVADASDVALGAFVRTPEGRRVISAAREVEKLVVRDPEGNVVAWESIAITDSEQFVALASAGRSSCVRERLDAGPAAADPPRFRMSLTLTHERMRDRMSRRFAEDAVARRRPALES